MKEFSSQKRPLLGLMDAADVEDESDKPRSHSYEDAIKIIGLGKFNVVLVLICGWANATDSVEVACISLVLTSLQCDMNATSSQLGWLTAVIFIGMMVGSYFWGSVGDLTGRKAVLMASLLVNGIFGFISSFMPNFWLFFAFRFLSGVGVGGSIPVIWSYFAEFQPSRIRGRMLSLIATFWMVGQLITAGLAWILIPRTYLAFPIGSLDFKPWRLFLALSTFTCITASFLVLFLPESPKYYLENGKPKKALKILAHIYETNTGNDASRFPVEYLESDEEMRGLLAEETKTDKKSVKRLWTQTKELFQRSLLWSTICILLINFSLSFGDSFLVSLSSLPGNLFTVALLDRVGRKPIFFVGAVVSAISAFFVWFVSSQTEVLVVSCVFGGLSVVCWNCLDAFGAELFPTHLRSTALGLSLAIARIGAILGNVAFGQLIDVHCAVPIVLVAVMIVIAALVSLKLKETSRTPLI